MAGLQRSSISFRRQGSSGLIWDDKLLLGALIEPLNQKDQECSLETTSTAEAAVAKDSGKGGRGALPQGQELKTEEMAEELKREDQRLMVKVERSRSNGGGKGFWTGKVVSLAVEPPSPKVSACGCCTGMRNKYGKTRRRIKNGERNIKYVI